jgi:three-Cys-motif partner protein
MVGVSNVTQVKQKDFSYFLEVYLRIAKAIIDKHGWACRKFQYIDLFAGYGENEIDGETIKGSPLLFLDAADRIGIEYEANFLEVAKGNCDRLSCIVAGYDNVNVIRGDNRTTFPMLNIPNNSFGLVYADPNASCPQFPILRNTFRLSKFQRIDLLINLGVNGIKRAEQVKCVKCELYEEKGNLSRCLHGIKKYCANTIEGRTGWGFNWVFLSNDQRTLMSKFGKLGVLHGEFANHSLEKQMMTKEYIKEKGEDDEHRYDKE